jgi:hypothetical protein
MSFRTIITSVLLATLIGNPGTLGAIDQKAPRPSLRLAKRLHAHKHYIEAVLVLEELLKRDPTDSQLLKLMIQWHETQLREEIAHVVVTTPAEKEEEIIPDLPGIVPNEPKNWPALLSKPKST